MELEALKARIAGCEICAERFAATATAHRPRPVVRAKRGAKVLIVGQAPGLRVHESSIPFDDRSGDRLRDWLGVSRAEFYDETRFAIVPMGFCFPGYNAKKADLPPPPICAKTWRAELMAALGEVALTIVIGGYAQRWHLGEAAKAGVTRTVENWRSFAPRAFPIPHPSWRNNAFLRRNPWFEAELLPALQGEVRRRV